MNGLDINSTPFKNEVAAVIAGGGKSPCYSFDLELMAGGERYKPISINSVVGINDFVRNYYPILAIEFQAPGYVKSKLIENNSNIEAVLKTYEIGRDATYSISVLRNPVTKRYMAKLYMEESDYITQENPAVNNEEYTRNKQMVKIKIQLVEKGFEKLKTRHVGGIYRNVSGFSLLRHLVDYHANLDNDDVATLISGVEFAQIINQEVREQIVIPHGTSLVESMHLVNQDSGGIYPTGFSYFIHNNVWHVFPPYDLGRFKENKQKLIIVNLPKNRLPGIERTYNETPSLVTIISTRDVDVKDKRESKKLSFGTGLRFGDVSKLLTDYANVIDNKLRVDASKNVNDIIVSERPNDVQQLRFSKNKLTASKNLELSKLAPSKGFMMRISWENSKDSLVYPGMPVKVLYLKRNKPTAVIGCVTGIESVHYPVEQGFPAMKFAVLTYIEVFVSDENAEG